MKRVILAIMFVASSVAPWHPVAAFGAPGAAGAVTNQVTLTLVAQESSVPPNGTASFTVEVTGAPARSVVALDVYLPVDGDDAAVVAAMNGTVRGQQFFPGRRVPIETGLDANHRATVTVPTSQDGRPDTFHLKTPGLYPVFIRVLDGTNTLARLTTFLTRIDPTSRPVPVAIVLPVDQAPTLQPNGSRTIDPQTRARLLAIDRNGSKNPSVPLTLAIRPDIIEALVQSPDPDDRALAARLAIIAARGEVLLDSAIAIDPSEASRNGLATAYQDAMARGAGIVSSWLGTPVSDSGTRFVSEAPSHDGLDLARRAGMTSIVTSSTTLAAQLTTTLAGPVRLVESKPSAGTSAPIPALVGDTTLGSLLASTDDVTVAVRTFLARIQALTPLPTAPLPQIALVAPPEWNAESGGALDVLMASLAQTPLLSPVTVRQELGAPSVSVRTFRDAPTRPVATIGAKLALVQLNISSLASMLPTPPTDTNALLIAATSTAITVEQREAYLAAAQVPTNPLTSAIEPLQTQRFTISSGVSKLPIRITSSLTTPILVRLHFSSDRAIITPNDHVVQIVDGLYAENIEINAREGNYPITLRVTAPASDQPLQTGTYRVQAFATGGLGVALTAGGFLVLATWWISHARRTRRRKQSVADSLRHPAHLTTG